MGKKLFCSAAVLAVLLLCLSVYGEQLRPESGALFVWEHGEAAADALEKVDAVSKKLPVDVIYKYFTEEEMANGEARKYCRAASEKGFSVWALDGSPDWGFEENLNEALSFVERVKVNNQMAADRQEVIEGIVLDVETYSTKEWKEGPQKIADEFESNMEAVYRLASGAGLSVSLCLPYWLDDDGKEGLLENLADKCCDEFLIMNYRCGLEYEGIEREVEIAREKGISLRSAFEFGEIGTHDLTAKNTYADKGIGEALSVWKDLKKKIDYDKFGCAWHSLKSIAAMPEEVQKDRENNPDKLNLVFAGTSDDADCAILSSKNECVIIDTGEKTDAAHIRKLLDDMGISEISVMILTHPDKDHIGGAENVIENYKVKQIIIPDYEKTDELLESIKVKSQEKNVQIKVMQETEEFLVGDMLFKVYPPEKKEYKKDNDYSLAALVTYGDISLFFAGDSEKKRLDELMDLELPVPVDIYKVTYHGRNTKNSDKLIEKIKPRYAIVTAEEPEEEIEEALKDAGSRILCSQGNDIIFSSDGKDIIVEN